LGIIRAIRACRRRVGWRIDKGRGTWPPIDRKRLWPLRSKAGRGLTGPRSRSAGRGWGRV